MAASPLAKPICDQRDKTFEVLFTNLPPDIYPSLPLKSVKLLNFPHRFNPLQFRWWFPSNSPWPKLKPINSPTIFQKPHFFEWKDPPLHSVARSLSRHARSSWRPPRVPTTAPWAHRSDQRPWPCLDPRAPRSYDIPARVPPGTKKTWGKWKKNTRIMNIMDVFIMDTVYYIILYYIVYYNYIICYI